MRKCILVLAALAAVAVVGSTAQAGDIPGNVLAQMGLGGMQKMSDAQGMRIRGQGTASVLGIGASAVLVSPVLTAIDGDSYQASSGPITNALATGSSLTTSQVQINVLNIPLISVISATAGSSFAFAR